MRNKEKIQATGETGSISFFGAQAWFSAACSWLASATSTLRFILRLDDGHGLWSAAVQPVGAVRRASRCGRRTRGRPRGAAHGDWKLAAIDFCGPPALHGRLRGTSGLGTFGHA